MFIITTKPTNTREVSLNVSNIVMLEDGDVRGTTKVHMTNGITLSVNMTPEEIREQAGVYFYNQLAGQS